MPSFRNINTGIIFSTLFLLPTLIWAQTPNQPLVPANKGGVASLAKSVAIGSFHFFLLVVLATVAVFLTIPKSPPQTDPTLFDVVGDIVSLKFYTIGGTEYAAYATSTGIIFIPSGSFESNLGHVYVSISVSATANVSRLFADPKFRRSRFVPRNTMQGDLADFVIRTDLTPVELHVLSTQVKGEMILRYNITAVFEGVSDRNSFLGEPRLIKTDLIGDISLFFNTNDGYTYASDMFVLAICMEMLFAANV
jgi:hypothetical protein